MVPMLAALRPSAVQLWRANTVTAAMMLGWRGWTLAAASASARRASSTRTKAMPSGSGDAGGCSATMAAAPATSAAGTNDKPSALVPGTATNASPGFTLRLSTATPVTARSPWRSSNAASGKSSRRIMAVSVGWVDARAAGGNPSMGFAARCAAQPILQTRRLPPLPPCGKDELVGGRQVEAGLEPEERRDARDHLAGGGHGIPARGRKAVGLGRRLRLIEHDQQ